VLINILYEDNSILIIKKPAGLATQSANIRQPDCVSLLKDHLKRTDSGSNAEPYVGVIHRLDQPVAGILVFAKNKRAAAALSSQVQSTLMNKHYSALVEGVVDVTEETVLTNLMYKDGKISKAVIVDDTDRNVPGVKIQEATLKYRTEHIFESENRTRLSIDLITGRFHQIRAQLSNIGHPIVGDRKYGAVTTYSSGIALIADKLEFVHPDTGEKVEKVVDFSFSL